MDRPIVAILAIGNELLRGDVENSNTRWLSSHLTQRGAHVVHAAIVRDEPEHITREFRHALTYSPGLLITSGGLGPTADDLTLAAIAQATGRPLEPNVAALAMVAGRYQELSRAGVVASAELSPSRTKMGTLPRGAEPLANRVGAAPGVLLEFGQVTVVCLPGVPQELYDIVENSLKPSLDRVLGPGVQRELVRFAGTPDESRLADALQQVAGRHPEVYVKSHAAGFQREGRFRVTLSTIAADPATAQRALERTVEDLASTLAQIGIRLEGDGRPEPT